MCLIKLSHLCVALFVAASLGVADNPSSNGSVGAAQAAGPAANQAIIELTVSGMS